MNKANIVRSVIVISGLIAGSGDRIVRSLG
jgi:hypothetical protein